MKMQAVFSKTGLGFHPPSDYTEASKAQMADPMLSLQT